MMLPEGALSMSKSKVATDAKVFAPLPERRLEFFGNACMRTTDQRVDQPLLTAKKQRGRPFKTGQSGNPSGRPKRTPEMVEIENLCREHSPEAVERLAAWMRSDNPRAAVVAAVHILERAWGKPRQPLEHGGGGNLAIQINLVDPKPLR
jgi:hypothetical protein